MRFNPISVATTKLDLYFHNVMLGSATGFFYRYGQTVGLVTNWHVLAGRNAIHYAPLDQRGYVPNRVEFSLNIFHKEESSIEFRAAEIALNQPDQSGWWQHAIWTKNDGAESIIDIGVIDLGSSIASFHEIAHKVITIPAHMLVDVAGKKDEWRVKQGVPKISSEVFIIGFPNGFGSGGTLPIWKRGSIASEPLYYNQDGEPIILVDALTRQGMSGAPVLYFGGEVVDEEGIAHPFERGDGEPWLVGVYAGRDGATRHELDMALSRVWRRNVLDQIFFDQCPGGLIPASPAAEEPPNNQQQEP